MLRKPIAESSRLRYDERCRQQQEHADEHQDDAAPSVHRILRDDRDRNRDPHHGVPIPGYEAHTHLHHWPVDQMHVQAQRSEASGQADETGVQESGYHADIREGDDQHRPHGDDCEHGVGGFPATGMGQHPYDECDAGYLDHRGGITVFRLRLSIMDDMRFHAS